MDVLKKFLHSFRRPRYIILFFTILLLGGYFFFQLNRVNVADVRTHTVRQQNLEEVLTFSGEVEAAEQATLQFLTGGRLAWVGVSEGERVTRYQGIAALDQQDLKKKLERELNDYAKERLDFDQQKDDRREVVIGALGVDARERVLRTFEQAQYDLNNAVLEVELQTITNQLSYLTSPIDGIAVRVNPKHAGVIVTPTTAQYVIVNPDTVYFSASADQVDVAHIREGMTGIILFDAYPEEEIVATVESISFIPKEGETGTVYEIKMKFASSNDTLKYRLGMTGDLEFKLREISNTLAIPVSYIKTEDSRKYVNRIVGGRQERVYVETGQTVDNLVEIKSGLAPGDVIYD